MRDPQSILDRILPGDRDVVQRHLVKESSRMELSRFEYRIASGNGHIQWMEHLCTPVFSRDGKHIGSIAINRDITHRKLTEREQETTIRNLLRQYRTLIRKEKLESLSRMAGGIAHEINNPLNFIYTAITPLRKKIETILGLLHRYRLYGDEPGHGSSQDFTNSEIVAIHEETDRILREDRIQDLLESIEEGASRIRENIRSLLHYSGSEEMQAVHCDVHLLMDDSLRALNLIPMESIEIRRDYCDTGNLYCKPDQLRLVFFHILSNAKQAIPGGGWISLSSSLREDFMIIEVRDSGPGIAEGILDYVFDPYFTTKEVGKGAGLGLFLCHEIIRNHGGTIEAWNHSGGGAVFLITLPLDFRTIL